MLDTPALVGLAKDMARHASARQSVIARNMANADTPGYRAMDLAPMTQGARAAMPMLVSRPGHLPLGEGHAGPSLVVDHGAQPSPNGNSVALEHEAVKAAQTRQSHDMALTAYRTAIDLVRSALGRR